MNNLSACKATEGKNKCVIRHNCGRYDRHLNSTSKQHSYIKPQFPVNSDCENFVLLNEDTYQPNI